MAAEATAAEATAVGTAVGTAAGARAEVVMAAETTAVGVTAAMVMVEAVIARAATAVVMTAEATAVVVVGVVILQRQLGAWTMRLRRRSVRSEPRSTRRRRSARARRSGSPPTPSSAPRTTCNSNAMRRCRTRPTSTIALMRKYVHEIEARIPELIGICEAKECECERVESAVTAQILNIENAAECQRLQSERTVGQLRGHVAELEGTILEQQVAHEREREQLHLAH